MADMLRGRWTVPPERGVVVFLIGARVNRLRSPRTWWPAVAAMPRMLAELGRIPDSGLLGARTFVSGRTVLVRQYWESAEKLQAYARDANSVHLPAWRRFNVAARRGGGAVGIFHETYAVGASQLETVQVDMPAGGIHEALGAVPVGPGRDTARERLGGDAQVRGTESRV